MYCLVIGGNYLPITARPSERGGEEVEEEEEGMKNREDDEIDEEDERKAGKEQKIKSFCCV